MRGINAVIAFVLLGLLAVPLSAFAMQETMEDGCRRMRECSFSNAPDTASVMAYVGPEVVALVLILFVANGLFLVVRHRRRES